MNHFDKPIEPSPPQWPSDACKYAATFVRRQCNFHPHNEQSEQLISMRWSYRTWKKIRQKTTTKPDNIGSIDRSRSLSIYALFCRADWKRAWLAKTRPLPVMRRIYYCWVVVVLGFSVFLRYFVCVRYRYGRPIFSFCRRFSEFSFFVSAHVVAIVRVVLCYVSFLVWFYLLVLLQLSLILYKLRNFVLFLVT